MKKDMIMTTLLVEDDKKECERFKDYIGNLNNIKLVGAVNSCASAIKHIKTHMPETIILDIELNVGQGTGIDLIEEINNMSFNFKPIIAVITNIFAKEVHDYLHTQGVHLVFYKRKQDYSAELVVSNLYRIWKSAVKLHNVNKIEVVEDETMAEKIERISKRIDSELDLVGIGRNLNGRKFIIDAVLYILNVENIDNSENVFNYLGKKYKKVNSSIFRTIQVSIEHAWRSAPIENLQKYYTQSFNYNRGNPTVNELIHYYVDKMRPFL